MANKLEELIEANPEASAFLKEVQAILDGMNDAIRNREDDDEALYLQR